ncbi:IS66-like element accessory protein TnpA [Sedimentitalea todarodis]|uniref:Transposase n=1 Tax=Sedimentitalea todarodis TaxID=1631240 RepID=A0ABU3VLY4_9RHOB|nr:transposase [Sedimentitalea todarodis]MDU9007222.1 transposase [Sedimentitalea todarodis]
MAGTKGQKKRFWSDDEKRSICAQTLTPGVSVAQVALRYAMNANLIFTWLRDPRFTPDQNNAVVSEEASNFLSVEIEGTALSPEVCNTPMSSGLADAVSIARFDITLSDGRRLLVEGPTALSSVAGLLQGFVAGIAPPLISLRFVPFRML